MTVAAVCSGLFKNQVAAFGEKDLAIEVVHITSGGDQETVNCAASAGKTVVVRTPLSAFLMPIDAAGGAAMGSSDGLWVAISGTTITIDGTTSGDDYHLWIIGRA
jgi:hypothetical protein